MKPVPFCVEEICSLDRCKNAGTYTLEGKCYNCGADQIVGTFTRGHEARDRSSSCPRCGCRMVYWGRS